MNCDLDILEDSCANVGLLGGTTMIQGGVRCAGTICDELKVQGMRGVSRCLLVPRGTCGAREQTIVTRGDPVLQRADEGSWACSVDLEATLLWR